MEADLCERGLASLDSHFKAGGVSAGTKTLWEQKTQLEEKPRATLEANISSIEVADVAKQCATKCCHERISKPITNKKLRFLL